MAVSNAGLSPEEVEVFAAGLHYIATQDGVDPREEKLIREFLQETQSSITFESLSEISFSPLEAAQVLSATYLRRIFLKAAVALVRADGNYSGEERKALGEIADAFEISNREFGELELQATAEHSAL